ncbi:MAG: hypothetical protein JSS13_01460, partial [Proteobacteria bacterium]|nr:hypothetical protein [Pseudomonadota bacterium]
MAGAVAGQRKGVVPPHAQPRSRGTIDRMTDSPTPVLLAWSGGKDSALALERLLGNPRWRVAGLLTTLTTQYDRIAIHGVRRSILRRQAAALGLPLFEAEIPPQASNEIYESAFAHALTRARERESGLAHI